MTDTNVWELAAATRQPLEVVIFQAVAYNAWQPGGRIGSEWAESLTQVLAGSHPWRRVVSQRAVSDDVDAAHEVLDLLALDADVDPVAAFAESVLTKLGEPVAVTDPMLAGRLASAGLGELTDDGFVGYPDELVTWSQLSHGEVGVEDLPAG
jgi:hypothetical protein